VKGGLCEALDVIPFSASSGHRCIKQKATRAKGLSPLALSQMRDLRLKPSGFFWRWRHIWRSIERHGQHFEIGSQNVTALHRLALIRRPIVVTIARDTARRPEEAPKRLAAIAQLAKKRQ
jgi:hypothetical protein